MYKGINIYEVSKAPSDGRYGVRITDNNGVVWEKRFKSVSGMMEEYRDPSWSEGNKNGYKVHFCPDCDGDEVFDMIARTCDRCGRSRSELVRKVYYKQDSKRNFPVLPALHVVK